MQTINCASLPELTVPVDKVRDWVKEAAQAAASNYLESEFCEDEDGGIDTETLSAIVDQITDSYGVMVADGLAILAAYDWGGALIGDHGCYEESAMGQFESDVYMTALSYLEERG